MWYVMWYDWGALAILPNHILQSLVYISFFSCPESTYFPISRTFTFWVNKNSCSKTDKLKDKRNSQDSTAVTSGGCMKWKETSAGLKRALCRYAGRWGHDNRFHGRTTTFSFTDLECHLGAHSVIISLKYVLNVCHFIAPFFGLRKKIRHKLRVAGI